MIKEINYKNLVDVLHNEIIKRRKSAEVDLINGEDGNEKELRYLRSALLVLEALIEKNTRKIIVTD